MEHVVGWMTEPKCTMELRQAWLDIWMRCDKDFGQQLLAQVKDAPAGHPSKMAATKA